ncbi:hypothetical protein QL285_040906 [Trifolium repens]|jgi:hypothetical protein|nr:hypothetical protein QL285_040906 [Trifolium repens]
MVISIKHKTNLTNAKFIKDDDEVFNPNISFYFNPLNTFTLINPKPRFISKGKLTKLKGISVKVELLWLKIVEVTRHGDDLQFSVGIASAEFSVDNFLEIPQCGCGFDCNGLSNHGNFSSI